MAKKTRTKIIGRPPKFRTAEELDKMVDKYFSNCPDEIKTTVKTKEGIKIETKKVPTVTGLCLYLGFVDKISFYDYEKKKNFTNSIKRARSMIESMYERNLQSTTPTGSIFALKNFGWRDKNEHEMYGKNGKALLPKPILDVYLNNSNKKDSKTV